MKRVNSDELKRVLEAEFLAISPKKQAQIILGLPSLEEKIIAVKRFIFGHKLYITAGFLTPKLISLAVNYETDESSKKNILSNLVEQPYFPRLWAVMKNIVHPSEAFQVIPNKVLAETLSLRASELPSFWGNVDQILSVYDDGAVMAVVFNLGSLNDTSDIDDRDSSKYKEYERLEKAKERADENWILKLFKSVSIETKAHIFASFKSEKLITKVIGVLATEYSGAGIADYFSEIMFGDFSHKDNDSKCFDLPLFAQTYKEAIKMYRTPPAVVLGLIKPIAGYRSIFPDIFHNLSLSTLKGIIKICPSMFKLLSLENKKLLKGDIVLSDIKALLDNNTIPGIVAKKIKAFDQRKKLSLLLK